MDRRRKRKGLNFGKPAVQKALQAVTTLTTKSATQKQNPLDSGRRERAAEVAKKVESKRWIARRRVRHHQWHLTAN